MTMSQSLSTVVALVQARARPNHTTARQAIERTRMAEPERTGRIESMIVTMESMPLYALMPMAATRAATATSASAVPRCQRVALPVVLIALIASVAPRLVAIHAPRGMSSLGEPTAPSNTAVVAS